MRYEVELRISAEKKPLVRYFNADDDDEARREVEEMIKKGKETGDEGYIATALKRFIDIDCLDVDRHRE